jgi:hypothetical protein
MLEGINLRPPACACAYPQPLNRSSSGPVPVAIAERQGVIQQRPSGVATSPAVLPIHKLPPGLQQTPPDNGFFWFQVRLDIDVFTFVETNSPPSAALPPFTAFIKRINAIVAALPD